MSVLTISLSVSTIRLGRRARNLRRPDVRADPPDVDGSGGDDGVDAAAAAASGDCGANSYKQINEQLVYSSYSHKS